MVPFVGDEENDADDVSDTALTDADNPPTDDTTVEGDALGDEEELAPVVDVGGPTDVGVEIGDAPSLADAELVAVAVGVSPPKGVGADVAVAVAVSVADGVAACVALAVAESVLEGDNDAVDDREVETVAAAVPDAETPGVSVRVPVVVTLAVAVPLRVGVPDGVGVGACRATRTWPPMPSAM